MPMLAPQQVIFVSDVEALGATGREPGATGWLKQISEYLDNPAPFTVLVFEATALDQRMRLAKMFAEKTVTVSVELSADSDETRPVGCAPWPIDMARELGTDLDRDAAEELCDLLSGELAATHTEISKAFRLRGGAKENCSRRMWICS